MARPRKAVPAEQYEVVGVLAVIRKDKAEQYLNRGVVFPADMIDEDNAAHLIEVGLIKAVGGSAVAEESDDTSAE